MYIGVDIGGTKIQVAGADDSLLPSSSLKVPTPDKRAVGLQQISQLIQQVAKDQPIQAIAISSGGPLDLKTGSFLSLTHLSKDWHNQPIVGFFEKKFKVPVTLEHDASAGGLGEAILGAAKNYQHVLYVTISTGIGTGLISHGQIHHGAYLSEGGHITTLPNGPICGCGLKGHFDAVVGGKAIIRDYGLPASEIHDPVIWDEIAQKIATGLANLIVVFSPEVVVLAGGVSVHFEKFINPLTNHLQALIKVFPPPPLVQAKFVETAPLYGALILAQRAAETINNKQ